jgi:hypothetical protein
VYGIIKAYDHKPELPAANVTATVKAAFKDLMNRHGVARLTILLGMSPRIQAEYTVIDDAKMHWEKLASAYESKLKLNIFEIREDLWSSVINGSGLPSSGPCLEPDRIVQSGLLPGKQGYTPGSGTGWNQIAVPFYGSYNFGSN